MELMNHLQISFLILSKFKQIGFYSIWNDQKFVSFLMILTGIFLVNFLTLFNIRSDIENDWNNHLVK